jgi:DNA repair protein RadC
MDIKFVMAGSMVKETAPVSGPETAVAAVMSQLSKIVGEADQEYFFAIPLNTANECGPPILIFMGGRAYAGIDMKILFRRILDSGASGFLIVHNHPSGSGNFSGEDRHLTARVRDAAKLLDLDFIDHLLIYQKDKWISYHNEVGVLR